VSPERELAGEASEEARGSPGPRLHAAGRGEAKLHDLMDRLPPDLAASVFTHASWTARRSDSYERLAFLGDSVLALAITAHLYPRLEADRYGAGRLTKIRAQAVSGRSCRAVADRLGLPELLSAAAPASAASSVPGLIGTERVLASVIEAVIGACYLAFGYETTAQAVVPAFAPEIEDALEHPVDYKSALQERLARRGAVVTYEVVDEQGPPHDRTFSISARIDDEEVGSGTGRSKKDAEQEAARAALEELE
jgi:ribonuclease-3